MPPSRSLTEADVEIWLQVASSVVARPGARLPRRAARPRAAEPEPQAPPLEQLPIRRHYAVESYVPPVAGPASSISGFERRFKRKVADGRIPVDAALDLHGMTQAQAHVALTRFLLRTQRDGGRLVIVVTGKGLKERRRTDAAEPGVLRRVVPFWLRDPVLRSVVMGFEEAAGHHGGFGALYVRLRKTQSD